MNGSRPLHVVVSFTQEDEHTTGIYFVDALRAQGARVTTALPAAPNRGLPGWDPDTHWDSIVRAAGSPVDAFFWIDPAGLLPVGIESASIPTACYLIDVHRDFRKRRRIARLFDRVFVAQKDYAARIASHAKWLPLAADPATHGSRGDIRKWDVGFVGRIPSPSHPRRLILDRIEAMGHSVNPQRYYRYTEIGEVYGSSRIVINYPVADDVNMRVFEAMCAGALLITKRVPNGLDSLFRDREHLILFEKPGEAADLAETYLNDESARLRIADAGMRLVHACHTYGDRARAVLSALTGVSARDIAVRRAVASSRAPVARAHVHASEGRVDSIFNAIQRARLRGRHNIVPYLAPLGEALARRAKRIVRRPR